MSGESLAALRAEYDRIAAALHGAAGSEQRAAEKAAIVALFKRTESTIAELAEFKEGIRDLVTRFKALPSLDERTSVRHDHVGASTYIERGWSELAAANWERAESLLREALLLDPSSTTAQSLLGWALTSQLRHDEALQLALQVLVRDPDCGLARVAVGVVCLRKGIVGEAIEHLTRVARHAGDPRATLYANYWLGVAYLEREMHGDAVEFLRRAVTLGPNLGEGWTELGRALWYQGHAAEATEAWGVGARIRHSPQAARCVELLDLVAAGGTPPRSPFASPH